MTIIAKKVVVSPDARITANLFTEEFKILGEDGKEREPTTKEMMRIANGHAIIALGRSDHEAT